ncbi:MAG TPA: hypothetical protein DCY54_04220 [Parachlamydiales bacterium]|nr:hypothetical protein [Parachlamydiales bacterium]
MGAARAMHLLFLQLLPYRPLKGGFIYRKFKKRLIFSLNSVNRKEESVAPKLLMSPLRQCYPPSYCRGARKRRVEYGLDDGLANSSDAFSKICGTLLEDFEKLWTFTKTLGMEPTNNLAERDLRKLVIWRKKSYGTRSERGKKFVERITTVAQTIRKHGGNVLHFVQQAVKCFYLRKAPPLISEALGF